MLRLVLRAGSPDFCAVVVGDTCKRMHGQVETLVAAAQLLLILGVVIVVLWSVKFKLSKELGGSLLLLYFSYVSFNILVDRDIIPLLGPIQEWLDVELAVRALSAGVCTLHHLSCMLHLKQLLCLHVSFVHESGGCCRRAQIKGAKPRHVEVVALCCTAQFVAQCQYVMWLAFAL